MKIRTALLGLSTVLPLAAPAAGQTLPAPVEEWRFSVSPYLWMAGMNGTVSMPGRSASFDVDFDDLLDSFEFGYMTQFEAW
ncbi:MAG: hypothetical protein K6T74_08065 [Geminicoccaceae bacterium]|nr:hypothetical protein [Geminicoccaceae bacterium]